MQFHDNVYGSTEITEPVLKSLMESTAVTRLHGVLQHGITGLIGITTPITRFEHSVGAMLLVRRLGGDLNEQIAALLHDVSHTAFSHVIDYVFDGHDSQSYHDEVKAQYVSQTDLPRLLARYGYDWRGFVDEELFALLEQPAPHLCADRLDYFLRDSLELDLATRADVDDVLRHLIVHDGRIVTDDVSTARWLAYTYIAADKASWANFREVGLYELTARAIRRALEIGYITDKDFWQTDRMLWTFLHASPDAVLRKYLELVSAQTKFAWDNNSPTFMVSTKLRTIDPDVKLDDDGVVPLSAIDKQFARYRLAYHSRREGLWPMRVIPPQA